MFPTQIQIHNMATCTCNKQAKKLTSQTHYSHLVSICRINSKSFCTKLMLYSVFYKQIRQINSPNTAMTEGLLCKYIRFLACVESLASYCQDAKANLHTGHVPLGNYQKNYEITELCEKRVQMIETWCQILVGCKSVGKFRPLQDLPDLAEL